jgi:hypothetical protein
MSAGFYSIAIILILVSWLLTDFVCLYTYEFCLSTVLVYNSSGTTLVYNSSETTSVYNSSGTTLVYNSSGTALVYLVRLL